ncbi:hypothetical protein BJ138DRAFT_1011772 [Hygrophoropsis aurantiaca]|uniref:Uncharacterized protein n=1 Tax=Hygrophoropsis aurantiaca TaxID=72124 RepID=A0ACB8A7H6_9AGAM|nr:hypothetical protein BJ138DRAFT_1011772 [Hygrophoropsis aurantiaca]
MAFESSLISRDLYWPEDFNKSSAPSYSQCTQCAPDQIAECMDVPCPIPEITSQCTDQCLVVACADPTHPEQTCQVAHGNVLCDGSCVDATDCADCPGLEDFILQCCTDYHSYYAEPKPPQESTIRNISWDSTLPNYMGDYSYIPEPIQRSQSCNNDISTLTAPENALTSTNSPYPPPSFAQPQTEWQSQSVPNYPQQSHGRPLQPLRCMWSHCNASFPTLPELVEHVNINHLRFPTPSETIHGSSHPENTSPFPLSCHWGDCLEFPSTEYIPGPSTGMSLERALTVVAEHILNDHLGCPHHPSGMGHPPSPAHTHYSSVDADVQPSGASPTPSVPPPTSSEVDAPPSAHSQSPSPHLHECSGTHECRWQNCSQAFTACDDLTTHIAAAHIGAGKAHYDCYWDGCTRHGESGFSSKQKISRHMQSHTGHRPFQCKICKQNFSEAATLQQHMRRHTQEKPYICDFPGCGKAFAITGALTIHKRTHNGLRPFKCTYCEKAFSESSNLAKHLRTHTGARPYPCIEDGCGKSFARPDQLARHMSVHRKKVGAASVN